MPLQKLYKLHNIIPHSLGTLGAYGTPFWGEGEVVGGSAMAPLERAIVVSYRLSIVTVALFGRNLRSNVYDAQINRGGG